MLPATAAFAFSEQDTVQQMVDFHLIPDFYIFKKKFNKSIYTIMSKVVHQVSFFTQHLRIGVLFSFLY